MVLALFIVSKSCVVESAVDVLRLSPEMAAFTVCHKLTTNNSDICKLIFLFVTRRHVPTVLTFKFFSPKSECTQDSTREANA